MTQTCVKAYCACHTASVLTHPVRGVRYETTGCFGFTYLQDQHDSLGTTCLSGNGLESSSVAQAETAVAASFRLHSHIQQDPLELVLHSHEQTNMIDVYVIGGK